MRNDKSIALLNLVSIVDLISKYIKLEKIGDNYRAKCPFHADEDPSFSVSPNLGIFKCFGAGCGVAGNAANFIQHYEDVNYHEALSILAEKVGKPHLAPNLEPQKFETVFEVNEMVLKLYQDMLFTKTEFSQNARTQLRNRRITQETARLFGVGYSPNAWTWLADQKLITKKDLIKAGLISKTEVGHYRDFFKNRIIFPIYFKRALVGFTGRTLGVAKKIPKYLNSKDSDWFKKSRLLYGYNITKEYIRKSKHIVLVEGQFDVLQLYQRGVKNSIAVSGSYFAGAPAKFISKLIKSATIFSDGDKAGVSASIRIGEFLSAMGVDLNIIYLEGKDPDEAAKYQHRFDWEKLNTKYSTSFPEFVFKHQSLEAALKRISVYPNKLKLSYALRELSELSGYDERYLERWLKEFKQTPFNSAPIDPREEQLGVEEELLLLSTRTNIVLTNYLKNKIDTDTVELINSEEKGLVLDLASNSQYAHRLLMIEKIKDVDKYVVDLLAKANLKFLKQDVKKFTKLLKETGDSHYLDRVEKTVKHINKLKMRIKNGKQYQSKTNAAQV